MGYEIILIGIWGGIVAMDTTAALQLMICHPIISCSVVGLLFGNLPVGLLVGILMELPWLYEVPVGTARFAEGNIGSTAAAAIAIRLVEESGRMELSVCIAIVVGVLISMIGGRLVFYMRNTNDHLIERLLAKRNLTPKLVSQYHVLGVIKAFLMGGGLTAICLYLFGYLLSPFLLRLFPAELDYVFSSTFAAIMGVGCAVFIISIVVRKAWWLFAIGLMIGGLTFLVDIHGFNF